MKILYIALQHEYGDPQKGFSYAYYNGYDALVHMNNGQHQVIFFPYDAIMADVGRDAMNRRLLETVEREKPDLCFFSLFNDEMKKETIKSITDSGTTTFNWFADDTWRFHNFTKHYAPLFAWVSTDVKSALKNYKKIGYNNVVVGCWGCNQRIFKPLPAEKAYDVTFVGQAYGPRIKLVNALKKAGIAIECFGSGWPNGRVSQERMIEIFSQSRINLNFSERRGISVKSLARIFFRKRNGKIVFNSPLAWADHARSVVAELQNEIKGRNFEIPGCAGFMITGDAPYLEDYYVPGKEVVIYKNTADLIAKIRHYLAHPAERDRIARAGYERTMQDHTYEKIFNRIFALMFHGKSL